MFPEFQVANREKQVARMGGLRRLAERVRDGRLWGGGHDGGAHVQERVAWAVSLRL